MINKIIEELEEKVKWHEKLAAYHQNHNEFEEENQNWIASMCYLRATQIVRKHAAEAQH